MDVATPYSSELCSRSTESRDLDGLCSGVAPLIFRYSRDTSVGGSESLVEPQTDRRTSQSIRPLRDTVLYCKRALFIKTVRPACRVYGTDTVAAHDYVHYAIFTRAVGCSGETNRGGIPSRWIRPYLGLSRIRALRGRSHAGPDLFFRLADR